MSEVPTDIQTRYKAGERRIKVTPEVFQAYADTLQAMYRWSPPQMQSLDTLRWLPFKDARVLCDLEEGK
jgi:hypothetical protein